MVKLAFNMLRGADTDAEGYLNATLGSSNSVQIPRDVVALPILDVLDKLNHFMQIAEEVAKIIMAQLAIDQSIADLADTMQDVYSFVDVIDELPSKIGLLEDIIQKIFIQTVECAIFIREYCGYGFAGRVLKETMGASTPAKVAEMVQSLIRLRDQFDRGVTVQIATVSFRIQEDVTTLLKNQTLMQLDSSGVDLSSRTGCLPGTCRNPIGELQNWALQPSEGDNSNIFWLHGMAGTGKSAIAATLARLFADLGRLGAFLAFDRSSPEQSHPSTVVQGFAHQISLFSARIGASIITSVNDDARVLRAPLSQQFDRLIVQPITSIPDLHGEGPIVVVIDGLDECGKQLELASLLEVLVGQTKTLPSNLRFIITSRTTNDIREAFTISEARIISRDLGLKSDRSDSDVGIYFKFRMQQIRLKNKDLRDDWPGSADLAELNTRANGFLMWAVAASNFIDAHSPPQRLEDLLLREDSSVPGADSPLDKFYSAALDSAGDWTDDYFVSDFRIIMGVIISLPISISWRALDCWLHRSLSRPTLRPSVVAERSLGSLLTQGPDVQILHTSFLDFLTSRERCGRDIWSFEPRPNIMTSPTAQCLQRMSTDLKYNICNMEFLTPVDKELLPEDVAYACQTWVSCICAITDHQSWVMLTIDFFVRMHLLHWFEAMSIIGKAGEILPMLERLAAWFAEIGYQYKDLTLLISDAVKFIRKFAAKIIEHPLHVYYTALPSHPTDSILYQTFHSESFFPDRGILKCLQRMNTDLKRNICNLSLLSPFIHTQVLPEELVWACQSWVQYICASTEHPPWVMAALDVFLQTQLVHWFEVMSIIKKTNDILPMLERIATWLAKNSLGIKRTLIIDAIKLAGSSAAEIEKHPLYVYCLALPLHLSDSLLYQTFHNSLVDPTVFIVPKNFPHCSDGRRYYAVVTGSGDIIIKEMATGQEVSKIAPKTPFESVTCVTFSNDGTRIAAASGSLVYVWDTTSGVQVIGRLGHSGWTDDVYALTWSPNGDHLLSVSDAGEMILWNVVSTQGDRLLTMRHPNPDSTGVIHTIESMAFTSNGSKIASCSFNGRVFMWDSADGNVLWAVQIHDCYNARVSFSSEHTGEYLLVTMDGGKEARDPATGDLLHREGDLAGAVSRSYSEFMANSIFSRIGEYSSWEEDAYVQWGVHREYFTCSKGKSQISENLECVTGAFLVDKSRQRAGRSRVDRPSLPNAAPKISEPGSAAGAMAELTITVGTVTTAPSVQGKKQAQSGDMEFERKAISIGAEHWEGEESFDAAHAAGHLPPAKISLDVDTVGLAELAREKLRVGHVCFENPQDRKVRVDRLEGQGETLMSQTPRLGRVCYGAM
ncbi:hypothetical protein HWV62_33771 [Athelia sp. TMB]|nr:hypothetical protein HWV62_33771 [Athelia sp. TMB]